MVLWSVALGMGIGILYGAASLLGVRLSKGRNVQQFTTIILGGMFIRIVVAICIIAVIFIWIPVETIAFIGAFAATILVVMVVEIWYAVRMDQQD